MLRKTTLGLLLVSMVTICGSALAGEDPTLHQVYQAAAAGKLNEAQGMMEKVLKDHPNSAKAHFVEAELLVKQGQLANAAAELNQAERLEPGLPFAKPQAVQDIKERISSLQPGLHTTSNTQLTQSHFPWNLLLLGLGFIGLILLIMRAFSSRSAAVGNYPTGAGFGQNGSAAPMTPMGGGIGSGIVSGLATGVAVGAGMVAGEALVHHFLDGNPGGNTVPTPMADSLDASSDSMGGTDFGVADHSSWDDSAGIADSFDIGGGDDWT